MRLWPKLPYRSTPSAWSQKFVKDWRHCRNHHVYAEVCQWRGKGSWTLCPLQLETYAPYIKKESGFVFICKWNFERPPVQPINISEWIRSIFCFLSTKWYALEIYPSEQVCAHFSVIIQDMGFINYFLKSKMKLLLGFPSVQYYWITWGSPTYSCSFSSCLTSYWMFSVPQQFEKNIHVNFNSYFPWSNLITYSLSIKKIIISWLLHHNFLFKQIQYRVIRFRMPHY